MGLLLARGLCFGIIMYDSVYQYSQKHFQNISHLILFYKKNLGYCWQIHCHGNRDQKRKIKGPIQCHCVKGQYSVTVRGGQYSITVKGTDTVSW